MANAPLTDQIFARLGRGITAAATLTEALGVSPSAVARVLRQLVDQGRALRIGSRRGARYARRRDIDGAGSQWPLRRVDRAGGIEELGTVYSLASDQYFVDLSPGAIASGLTIGGISDSVPYFLQDQRPGGFLGRAVPARYPELRLPERVTDWTDDHYLRYLTQRGSDAVSDLILGDDAFDEHLAGLRHRPVIAAGEREARFPAIADEVMSGGLPGSSAHGEHPKFAAVVDSDGEARAVIVKFSPPRGTEVGQRWSDLLIAEHIAHRFTKLAGLPACASEIATIGDRTYLEVARFDRHGTDGRVGATSLLAIEAAAYGALDNWVAAASRLYADRRIDAATLAGIRLAYTFGGLIGNTDRHFGNLALYDDYRGRFDLAPIYDMLPMLYAPEHDQLVARVFVPPDPTAATIAAWPRARELAAGYWRAVADDARVSEEFRAICRACGRTLEALPRSGAFARTDHG